MNGKDGKKQENIKSKSFLDKKLIYYNTKNREAFTNHFEVR